MNLLLWSSVPPKIIGRHARQGNNKLLASGTARHLSDDVVAHKPLCQPPINSAAGLTRPKPVDRTTEQSGEGDSKIEVVEPFCI
jgi:hypothetical protein